MELIEAHDPLNALEGYLEALNSDSGEEYLINRNDDFIAGFRKASQRYHRHINYLLTQIRIMQQIQDERMRINT